MQTKTQKHIAKWEARNRVLSPNEHETVTLDLEYGCGFATRKGTYAEVKLAIELELAL